MEAGDLLVKLDDAQAQVSVAQAEANVQRALGEPGAGQGRRTGAGNRPG